MSRKKVIVALVLTALLGVAFIGAFRFYKSTQVEYVWDEWSEPAPLPIKSVQLIYSKETSEAIVGFQYVYRNKEGKLIEVPKYNYPSGDIPITIELEQGPLALYKYTTTIYRVNGLGEKSVFGRPVRYKLVCDVKYFGVKRVVAYEE